MPCFQRRSDTGKLIVQERLGRRSELLRMAFDTGPTGSQHELLALCLAIDNPPASDQVRMDDLFHASLHLLDRCDKVLSPFGVDKESFNTDDRAIEERNRILADGGMATAKDIGIQVEKAESARRVGRPLVCEYLGQVCTLHLLLIVFAEYPCPMLLHRAPARCEKYLCLVDDPPKTSYGPCRGGRGAIGKRAGVPRFLDSSGPAEGISEGRVGDPGVNAEDGNFGDNHR